MNILLVSTLASAVISAALAFGSAWKIQSWRMDAQEKQRAEQIIETQKLVFRKYEVDQERVHTAQNTAVLRQRDLLNVLNAARDELDGLRRTSDEANRRIAAASADALRQYATTANSVLAECTRAYLGVAEKAQGHANDVGTLTEAWPKP